MLFKNLLRFTSFTLMIGAITILGLLSFSGIYILTPILGLAITAFILSVIFEGEIYYQNISKAIKSLLKPHYIESKLTEECLQEAIKDITDDYKLIHAIDEFTKKLDYISIPDEQLREEHEKITEMYEDRKTHSKFQNIRKQLTDTKVISAEKLELFFQNKSKSIKKKYSDDETQNVMMQMSFTKTKVHPKKENNFKNDLSNLKDQLISQLNELNIPQFFIDYAHIASIVHNFDNNHINPTKEAKARKETLEVSLSMLEQIFTEQLFSHTQSQKEITKNSLNEQLNTTTNKNEEISQKIQEYKSNLQVYLKKYYIEKYKTKLPVRKSGSKFIKILSSICGFFMIIGTSYLLVEAFAVVPLLSAIPFGILPAIIVPFAVIAGIAYGIQTYQALDEMLNSDIISKRLAQIKADIKQGLNLYTGAKLIGFILLLGLAVTLTVFTGGTWYTVVKHTKPLFIWLRSIPTAVAGIIAGFLAIAAGAFNISNSAQTSEELEEALENVPEDHPYNIDLLEVPEGKNIETCIKYTTRTAIIKQGNKYFIHCCPSNTKKWERIEVPQNAYLTISLLKRLNFANKILYYSAFNTYLYNLIRIKTAHKFNPSKENWKQFLNPARIFLLFTYVPLRILLFLGHLASTSATADRIPGIPEIISMIIGFIAELFEDLHYFASFEHNHKTDLPSIIEERFKGDEDHHANDLPTKILRDYLFAPVFWLAAAWHSIYSTPKNVIVQESMIKKQVPSVSVNDAYEQMRGKKPQTNPQLKENDENFVKDIENEIKEDEKTFAKQIESKEDLVEKDECRAKLLKTLVSSKHKRALSIFATNDCQCNPSTEISRANILLV